MGAFQDLTGQQFGRLTVIRRGESQRDYDEGRKRKRIRTVWVCQCSCGEETSVLAGSLKSGVTQSCGCLLKEKDHLKTHDMSKSSEYRIWVNMKTRCYNPAKKSYPNYGGRGIKVCPQWLNSFETFLADMGARPSVKHTIDRIDNDGPYSPENCQWATWRQQHSNTRQNRFISYGGETLTLAEWSRRLGGNRHLIEKRLRMGWSEEKVVTTPIQIRDS